MIKLIMLPPVPYSYVLLAIVTSLARGEQRGLRRPGTLDGGNIKLDRAEG